MIDIIIVNWNAGIQLVTCIDSILRHGADLVGEIVVVDNGSADNSVASLKSSPNVNLIRAGANLGFGKACNLGAQRLKSDYLLFLNPDAALYPSTLGKTLEYMEEPAHAKVAICGVQLLDDAGNVSLSCARFPSAMGFVAHAVGIDRCFPALSHSMLDWGHGQTQQVNQVIGAFFMVRRSVFESLRGFDERFFVYFEEVDFSYRASLAGWKTAYLANVQAFHAGGGTSNQVKARRLFYSLRSRLLYAFKHFSRSACFIVILTTLVIEPLSRFALALVRGSWSGLKETWSAYGMLWHWLPQWVLKGVTR